MENKRTFLKTINTDFFEFAPNKFKSKFYSMKHLIYEKIIEIKSPSLYVCNKTTKFDKCFVGNTLRGDYVFLKEEILSKIRQNKISKTDKDSLLKQIRALFENNFSLVVFPEKNITLFGKCETIPKTITEFLVETKYDLKFLYLINTYFTNPVWASHPRKCDAKFSQQFSVTHECLSALSPDERNEKINKMMPSSASNYASKFKPLIRSNNLAEDLETIMYCCPHCGKFFSLYSEFNCLKCHECMKVIEFTRDGRILFSSAITNYDEIENFLFEKLKQIGFTVLPIVKHSDIIFNEISNDKTKSKPQVVSLDIYADKIEIKNDNLSKKIKISSIQDIVLEPNNQLRLTMNDKTLTMQGKNKQNLYILFDLLKLHKNA